MRSHRARASALALIATALSGACGDDESLPDGGGDGAADAAAVADSGAIDAGDDRCPGLLTFEALVADGQSGEATFEVDLVEVDGSASAQSAPNGRALLCLPAGADAQVRSTKADYLERLDTVSAGALAIANATFQPYPLDVLATAAADGLLEDLELERDEAASLLMVSVVSYPDGEPLAGATATIDKESDGAFARDAGGAFAATAEGAVAAGRVLMFANVALGGGGEEGSAAITVTPPDGFRGTCVGPPSVELVAGGSSGAFFACQ